MSRDRIEVRAVQSFDANGQLFRAFDYLIARRAGGYLFVPIGIAIGSVKYVVDRCPVPVEEAVAIIDQAQLRNTQERPEHCAAMSMLLPFAPPAEWEVDHIAVMHSSSHPSIRRFSHANGIRYAEPILEH